MRVSILLLGVFLMALHTIYVMAEHQPGVPYAPSKRHYGKTGRHVHKSFPDHREKMRHGHVPLDHFSRQAVPGHENLKVHKNCWGVNEKWSHCGKGPCEEPSCMNIGKALKCNPDGVCVAGCICKKGYFRNYKNKCVKPSKCANYINSNEEHNGNVGENNPAEPKKSQDVVASTVAPSAAAPITQPQTIAECPIDEHFDECTRLKRPESCADIYTPYNVTYPIDSSACTPQCICDTGLYRNAIGSCVPVYECPNYVCTSRELYNKCPQEWICEDCDTTCVPNIFHTDSELTVDHQCTPRCMCNRNEYCKTPNGECIVNEGPESCPKPNTQYSECTKPAWVQSCDRRNEAVRAPGTFCFRGCECKPGYYRNTTLDCVAPNDCECPIDEIFEECRRLRFPESCADLYTPSNVTNTINKSVCTPKCICKPGLFRNATGSCIPFNQCPCPDPNAEMTDCYFKCNGGTCDNPVIRRDCDDFCDSSNRFICQCKRGFVSRSLSNSTCTPIGSCPSELPTTP